MRRAITVSATVVFSSSLLFSQALFQKPVKVLGDPNFIGTAASPLAYDTVGPNWVDGRELDAPAGIALDNSVSPPILYIADTGNNRVLAFRYATQLVAGSVADVVIGQLDRFANQAQNPASGGRQLGLNSPTGLAVDSAGNLYVADTGNNRILRFPQPLAPNANQFPTLVVGQKSYATSSANLAGIGASTLALSGAGRTGIAIDAVGNLWVADSGNSRVLRFPVAALSPNATFPAADLVLGQPDFVTKTPGTARLNLASLAGPNGLAVDTTGNVYVTDQFYRVLVYNTPVKTSQTANAVLGIDTTTTNVTLPTQTALNNPLGLLAAGTAANAGPIVADTGNHRLMLYPQQGNWPSSQTSPSASAVIGQPDYTQNKANQGNVDAGPGTLDAPLDMAASSTELYLVDAANNRVLVFQYDSSGVRGTASRVIGQLDFPYRGVNLLDALGFAFPPSFPASAVLDSSVSPPHLYVADTFNNRILGYKDFTHLHAGQPADLVIGQPDMNRNVVNYPSGSATTPTASGLYQPTSIALDSAGSLYVTDTGNGRVLRFPTPYASGKTALESADLVLGQQTFNSNVSDPTAFTLNTPVGLAFTASGANTAMSNSGYLAVADSAQHRVLLFQKPFTSGMSATVVLGQLTFNGAGASPALLGMNSPRGVSIDPQDRVLVADTGNSRVLIFDQAANLQNGATPLINLTGLSTPLSIAMAPAGDFWVAEYSASRFTHYPSLPNLALTNNASDSSLPVFGPHSGFIDPYNNLLATDQINRVLYYAPQVSYQNAANYSTRPLTAGTIAALYPTVTTNSIAGGTSGAPPNQFPLPQMLSDTQVTVNGVIAPLYFVSPGQDNVILPQVLPTTGTVDLRIIRPSTGQILGSTEVQLAPASPAMFTNPATGSGQLVAVNFQDGSTNSPKHPVVRGQYVILYGTGLGPIPNPPSDGAAASGQSATDFPTVLVTSSGPGSPLIPADVNYSGLAPGFAGLWQINVLIPNNAQSGSAVTVKVYEKDIPNLDQGSSLTTTLSIN
jgi:uncharacterized protein (TIGR03437 family)